MIRKWLRTFFLKKEAKAQQESDLEAESIGCKLRALDNIKRINEAILLGTLEPHQYTELELGAETISMNLKKADTDKVKEKKV